MKKFSICLLLSVISLTGANLLSAQDYVPRFVKHIVKQGDTPLSVSYKYNIKTTDFLLLNDFPNDVKLKPGQVVLIRRVQDGEVYQEPVAAPETSKPVVNRVEPAQTKPVSTGTSVKPTEVKPAATYSETKSAEPKPVVTKADFTGPNGVKYAATSDVYYTVMQGQTFYRIALINGLTVDELKALNNLSNTNIEVGQKLRVKK